MGGIVLPAETTGDLLATLPAPENATGLQDTSVCTDHDNSHASQQILQAVERVDQLIPLRHDFERRMLAML